MQLSPRALQALIDIRQDLLSREPVREDPPPVLAPKEENRPRTFVGRKAKRSNAFQRACQRHTFWSPVY